MLSEAGSLRNSQRSATLSVAELELIASNNKRKLRRARWCFWWCVTGITVLIVAVPAAVIIRLTMKLSAATGYLLSGLGAIGVPILAVLLVALVNQIFHIRDAKRALAGVEGSRASMTG